MPLKLSAKDAARLIGSADLPSKYRSTRTQVDGLTFSSVMEARRWGELQLLQRAGQLRALRRQETFILAPAVRLLGAKRQTPALRYVADFVYEAKGSAGWYRVIEDCKGHVTEGYRIKRHLMKALLGLDILETKPR